MQAMGLLLMVRLRHGAYQAARLAGYFLSVAVIAFVTAYACRWLVPTGENMVSAFIGLGAIFVAVLLYLLVTWWVGFDEVRFIFGGWKRRNQSD